MQSWGDRTSSRSPPSCVGIRLHRTQVLCRPTNTTTFSSVFRPPNPSRNPCTCTLWGDIRRNWGRHQRRHRNLYTNFFSFNCIGLNTNTAVRTTFCFSSLTLLFPPQTSLRTLNLLDILVFIVLIVSITATRLSTFGPIRPVLVISSPGAPNCTSLGTLPATSGTVEVINLPLVQWPRRWTRNSKVLRLATGEDADVLLNDRIFVPCICVLPSVTSRWLGRGIELPLHVRRWGRRR